MADLNEYIQEEYITNRDLYESIKDSITCAICTNIIIKPTMCMNCQKAYCRRCIEHWNNIKNYCPNKCDNPEYKKSVVIANLLTKLNFTCKDCFSTVNYDQMERHILSKCDTVEGNYKIDKSSNVDGIFQKLNRGKKVKIKFDNQVRTKMKSKYIYFIIKTFIFNYSYMSWFE